MAQEFLAGPQQLLRTLNTRAVLDALDAADTPLSRAALAAATGLSRPTIAQALDALRERGAVREHEHTARDGSRGPNAHLYEIDPGLGYALGLQIGHTTLRAVVISTAGKEYGDRVAPRRRDNCSAAALATALADLAEQALDACGADRTRLGHAVLGVPALVATDRRTIRHGRALGDDPAALLAELTARLPVPFVLENDANLAALAEQRHGAGQGLDDFVLLRLGSGLGAGLVLGGRLHRGAAGGAGEAGYLPQPGLGVGEHVLPTPDGPPSPDLFARALAGERAALLPAMEYARRLSLVIASVCLLLEPQAVVVGGPVGHANQALLDLVGDQFARDAGPLHLRLLASPLPPDTAVLRGAAGLAREELRNRLYEQVCA
ncbi:ROK family protein [Streptomyces sp. NPDC091682]|uniref:ROK family transcriptional regulator n=1 Tax=Streptomyces sp. NPDC091682 TaxID=3366005 RepID=UPI0037FD4AEA